MHLATLLSTNILEVVILNSKAVVFRLVGLNTGQTSYTVKPAFKYHVLLFQCLCSGEGMLQ